MKIFLARMLGVIVLIVCLIPLSAWGKPVPPVPPVEPKSSKTVPHILILYSYGYNLPAQQQVTNGFYSIIRNSQLSYGYVLSEYLDITPPRSPEQLRMLREFLLNKYAGQKFDLIITIFDAALDFVLNEGKELSPASPCLALLSQERPSLMRAGQKVLQIPFSSDPGRTLKLALKFFPQTQRVLFVAGLGKNDRAFEKDARAVFTSWPGKLEFEYTSSRSVDELLERVDHLPPETIVIYSTVSSDVTGKVFIPLDVVKMLSKKSNAPIFAIINSMLGSGVVGGYMNNAEGTGAMLARKVLDIKAGRPLAVEPPSTYVRCMLDWKQLERWDISTSLLPADSLIINRPPTIWSQYKNTVIISLTILVILICFILVLLFENYRRKIAEQSAREAKEKILMLNNELEQRVIERTAQLTAKTVELETINKELSSFSYSVSHDLRAPLRGIDGFSNILLMDYRDKLDAEGKQYLDRIRRAAQTMGRLIEDMISLARLTRAALHVKNVNLSDMVRNISDANKQKNHALNYTVEIHNDISVRADEGMMNIVLTNLLDNAFKFTAKSGHPRIQFGAEMRNGDKVIFVRDNGIGFDMSYATKVFEAFQKLHTSDEYPGTGIGLATVRRIIERHGGLIWVESEPGKGTVIFFTIPAEGNGL